MFKPSRMVTLYVSVCAHQSHQNFEAPQHCFSFVRFSLVRLLATQSISNLPIFTLAATHSLFLSSWSIFSQPWWPLADWFLGHCLSSTQENMLHGNIAKYLREKFWYQAPKELKSSTRFRWKGHQRDYYKLHCRWRLEINEGVQRHLGS